jgi:hypothetical protein
MGVYAPFDFKAQANSFIKRKAHAAMKSNGTRIGGNPPSRRIKDVSFIAGKRSIVSSLG